MIEKLIAGENHSLTLFFKVQLHTFILTITLLLHCGYLVFYVYCRNLGMSLNQIQAEGF